MILTLRPDIQRLALDQLAGRCGAVVVLDAKTGAVLAMASSPTYNANLMLQPTGFNKVKKIKGTCGDASALVNNATAGLYPPGSTFKMVTAAAALDSGAYTPSSPFNDPGYCTEYGQRVSNAGNPDQSGPEAFGNVTLAQGFEHSINSVFCNVGKHIGGEKILEYAKRFGFYSLPPLETPSNERLASGLYKNGRLFDPANASQIDPGRLAFGQFSLLATPLQMAMVGQAIANGGEELQPYLVDRIVAPDGSLVSADDAALARPADQAADGGRAEPDDAARRPGRDGRDRRVPSRPQGRRQDGHRGARPRDRLRRVVRLLRPRRQPALCRRGRRRRSSRTASAPRSRPRSPRQSSKN